MHRRFAIMLACSPLSACFLLEPTDEAAVPLPITGATAQVEAWRGLVGDARVEIVARNSEGTVRQVVWQDWGPAQRASLYLTPQHWLVVIGGGGAAQTIDLSPGRPPRSIPSPRGDGSDWTYIGAVDREGHNGPGPARLMFYPPTVQSECVPLYGAGYSRYRVSHQDQHNCARSASAHGGYRSAATSNEVILVPLTPPPRPGT